MASSSLPISEEEIKKVLLVQKVITETDWEDAKKNASRRRRAIEEVLIERGFFNEQFLYELLGDLIKIPYANLRKIKLEPEIINLLDEKIARSSQAIPFALEQDKIKVAFVNPLKKDGVEAVTQALKKPILPYLTSSKNFFFAAHLYEKNITEELHEIINQKFKQVQGRVSWTYRLSKSLM